jgi:hypothetical protein
MQYNKKVFFITITLAGLLISLPGYGGVNKIIRPISDDSSGFSVAPLRPCIRIHVTK